MPAVARLVVHAVALLGMAAVAFALGDWLRDPQADASLLGLLVLAGVCALALRHLYGPHGPVAIRPAPPTATAADDAGAPAAERRRARPRRPARREPAAPLWTERPEPRGEPPAGDDRVDVNTASEAELQTLPGVGPRLAVRIQSARPFRSLDDLAEVPGFTQARVRAIADRIRL